MLLGTLLSMVIEKKSDVFITTGRKAKVMMLANYVVCNMCPA